MYTAQGREVDNVRHSRCTVLPAFTPLQKKAPARLGVTLWPPRDPCQESAP